MSWLQTENIERIGNAVSCHSLLKSHYETAVQNYHSHRVALSVCSEVTGLKDYQLGHRGQPTDLHTDNINLQS